MNLSEIQTRVWEKLEESSTSPLRYPASLVEQYVSDGERFYVARTGCLTTTQTVTQVPNTLMYDLETDCVQVERVSWNNSGTYYRVAPTTARNLDDTWPHASRWIEQTGTRATHYFIFGMNRIALWPKITSGTESYIVHYQQDVPAATEAGATTPEEDHELLVSYAFARCLLRDGKVKKGMRHYNEYMEGVLAAQRRMASADRVWRMGRQIP
jgi:hypothetical protein